MERALGPEHPALAESLDTLARRYTAVGDLTRAEPLYQRALAIQEQALGPDHPDVGATLQEHAALFADRAPRCRGGRAGGPRSGDPRPGRPESRGGGGRRRRPVIGGIRGPRTPAERRARGGAGTGRVMALARPGWGGGARARCRSRGGALSCYAQPRPPGPRGWSRRAIPAISSATPIARPTRAGRVARASP
ncbi:MAG: hypothetical protein DMD79_11895 [Candidatus Rokuibacteriota bacterium]|nr:MAG: hypothetical protein DMD79_11895 [Candidatus Rokubacteria bacterium]